jgi:hypothetical protein
MQILSSEGETHKLLEQTQSHPNMVFDYGKQLSREFPNDVFSICVGEIRKQSDEADNRTKYKKVCGLIKKLYAFGGEKEAADIIAQLKASYPRRPAFLDELDTMLVKLKKRK